MSSFAVKNLVCKNNITNEVLDIIATQIICEEEGLSSIALTNFKESCGPFDESLLERLSNQCFKLQKLEMSQMFDLSTDSRQQLTNMVVRIIKSNQLSHLNLESFRFERDGEHGE